MFALIVGLGGVKAMPHIRRYAYQTAYSFAIKARIQLVLFIRRAAGVFRQRRLRGLGSEPAAADASY